MISLQERVGTAGLRAPVKDLFRKRMEVPLTSQHDCKVRRSANPALWTSISIINSVNILRSKELTAHRDTSLGLEQDNAKVYLSTNCRQRSLLWSGQGGRIQY